LELKKDKRIITVVYKNCVLYAKLSDNNLIPVKSQNDFGQLQEQLSYTMDQDQEAARFAVFAILYENI
jgi:hypothetical protein